jgi:predicted metal-dependent phosphoesterase TrpH
MTRARAPSYAPQTARAAREQPWGYNHFMHTIDPFDAPGRWFRGNTHSHSTVSDGRVSMAERFAGYRAAGYDFLVLTDHRKVSDVSAYSDASFLAISGTEAHPPNPYGGERYHIVGVNVHEPVQDEDAHPNEVIGRIRAQGGEAILCHPYWCGHTLADLGPLQGYMAVEVYNDTCMQIGKGYSEAHWDDLLDRAGPCWGIAADDAHDASLDCYHAWLMVKAEALDLPHILDALRAGAFYSTQGPEIRNLRLEEGEIERPDGRRQTARMVVAETSPAASITFLGDRHRGARRLPAEGERLTRAEYPLLRGEKYVRVEVLDDRGRKAWSNPVFLAGPA